VLKLQAQNYLLPLFTGHYGMIACAAVVQGVRHRAFDALSRRQPKNVATFLHGELWTVPGAARSSATTPKFGLNAVGR
jgi:acetoacetate decarboxylase